MNIVTYIIALIVFLVSDLIWIGVIAKSFYFSQLATFLADKPNWPVALIFYALFILGLTVFVIQPSIAQNQDLKTTIGYAFLFGLVTYGTWDLTNLALFKGFPTKVAIVDIIWGGTIATLVTVITKKINGIIS